MLEVGAELPNAAGAPLEGPAPNPPWLEVGAELPNAAGAPLEGPAPNPLLEAAELPNAVGAPAEEPAPNPPWLEGAEPPKEKGAGAVVADAIPGAAPRLPVAAELTGKLGAPNWNPELREPEPIAAGGKDRELGPDEGWLLSPPDI